MRPLRKTPLEGWIRRRIGLQPGAAFTRQALLRHQLAAIRESLTHAAASSPFYRRRFAGRPGFPPQDLQGFTALPLTTADLAADPLDFLAVSQSAVARVVTLRSSGTSAPPKRLFFSPADLQRTVDFFHHGMSTLVAPGQRVLILMPGEQPGSVGRLLVEGLGRLGAAGMVHGPVHDPGAAVAAVLTHRPDCLVGIPVQVLAMARHPRGAGIPRGLLRSVLLSTDYVPEAIVGVLERTWGCRVFQHYGMTEMGYGGAVACEARDGYHLREADLFVEVVDPETGRGVQDGVSGEVVFTTLAVSAMPLIRYRTGDTARFCRSLAPAAAPPPVGQDRGASGERRGHRPIHPADHGGPGRGAFHPARGDRLPGRAGARGRAGGAAADGPGRRRGPIQRAGHPRRPGTRAGGPGGAGPGAADHRSGALGDSQRGLERGRQTHHRRQKTGGRGTMNSIPKTAVRLLDEGRAFVLATIVSRHGSTPRTAGTRMIVTADGSIRGTIGGGLVEAQVIERAGGVLRSKRPVVMPFDLTRSEVAAMDMICGGRLEVLLECVQPGSPAEGVLRGWGDAIGRREASQVVTLIRFAGAAVADTDHLLIQERRVVVGGRSLPDEVLERILDAGEGGAGLRSVALGGDLACGRGGAAGGDCLPLRRRARGPSHLPAGRVRRVPRGGGGRSAGIRQPRALPRCGGGPGGAGLRGRTERVPARPRGLRRHSDPRAPPRQVGADAQALRTDAGYIGMIGSRRKRDQIYAALRQEGFTEADLQRVASPIGLPIGAETPEEIAISIVAELIQVRARRRRP
jgi:phenylacetate-CoA ligase